MTMVEAGDQAEGADVGDEAVADAEGDASGDDGAGDDGAAVEA